VTAAIDSHQNEARSALVALCEAYWYPLYAYVRRRGYPADQAQDFTQEFFVRVLEGRYLERADPEKGRFRAFILTCMKFFLADEGDRVRALKRGGGAVLSLEMSSGEERYEREPAHEETPATGSWTRPRQGESQRRPLKSAGTTACPLANVSGVCPSNDAWPRASL